MPDILELKKATSKASSYAEFRECVWDMQGSSIRDDKGMKLIATPNNPVVFIPKPMLFKKDEFHFPNGNAKVAAKITRAIFDNPSMVRHVQVNVPNGIIYVDYYIEGGKHILPGQDTDSREIYRSR